MKKSWPGIITCEVYLILSAIMLFYGEFLCSKELYLLCGMIAAIPSIPWIGILPINALWLAYGTSILLNTILLYLIGMAMEKIYYLFRYKKL